MPPADLRVAEALQIASDYGDTITTTEAKS